MGRARILLPLAAFALVALAAACGDGGSSALEGTSWRLERIGAQSALPQATPWLKFEDGGDFGGNTGCNSLGGKWEASGDELTLSDIVSTLIGCEGAIAEQETAFNAALQAVARYEIDGDTLSLRDAGGAERMTLVPMVYEVPTPMPTLDERTPSVGKQLDDIATRQAVVDQEERFNGELFGFYLAPTEAQVPLAWREEHERISSGGCVPVSLDQAAALDFPRPLVMPAGYTLAATDGAGAGSNPYAIACGGTVTGRGWEYTTAGASGIPANITIVRNMGRYDVQSVAKSQVSTPVIGGRQAIVIAPIAALGQRVIIHFPESFGATSVMTFNLAMDDAMKVAEAVAAASTP